MLPDWPNRRRRSSIMELIRKQVVEQRGNRLLGEVALASPTSTWSITWLISAIVAGVVMVLLIGNYARKEEVYGWLKPDKGLVRLVSPALGIVQTVHVDEYQSVREGDPLITLNLDIAFAAGESVFDVARAELETQIIQREKLIPLTEVLFQREADDLKGRMISAQAELAALKEQFQVVQERIDTVTETHERFDLLAQQNAASTVDVEQQLEKVLSLRQIKAQVEQQIEIKKGEIASYAFRLEDIPTRRETEIIELREIIAGLRAQKAQVSGQGTMVVTAPVSGRVAALPVTGGQSVRPHEMAIALLPDGGRLEAELFVPTRAAGFIKQGQAVRLQFDAFPYQRFETVEGVVLLVSRTIFDPSELPVSLGISEPVYRVTVSIPVQHIDAYGERFPLQAGMTLRAHIVQEERRLWEVLLEPLRVRL